MTMIGHNMMQQKQQNDSDGGIPKTWLLINTCSTVNTVCNLDNFVNIRGIEKGNELQLFSDGSMNVYDKEGSDLKLFPLTVFYNPNGIANVLSLKAVASIPGTRVTMDTSKARAINVKFVDGRIFVFNECEGGLYFLTQQK